MIDGDVPDEAAAVPPTWTRWPTVRPRVVKSIGVTLAPLPLEIVATPEATAQSRSPVSARIPPTEISAFEGALSTTADVTGIVVPAAARSPVISTSVWTPELFAAFA